MLSSAALRKTGSGWEFANEEALEDFVEVHLQSLLGLTVIKRQFTVNEQRCDIIAVDENKRLVVLELKNGEDRYVVQQLTRYYGFVGTQTICRSRGLRSTSSPNSNCAQISQG